MPRGCLIGVKGPLNSKEDLAYADRKGVELVTYENLRAEGAGSCPRSSRSLGDAPAYVTFDIDCVDPALRRERERRASVG